MHVHNNISISLNSHQSFCVVLMSPGTGFIVIILYCCGANGPALISVFHFCCIKNFQHTLAPIFIYTMKRVRGMNT